MTRDRDVMHALRSGGWAGVLAVIAGCAGPTGIADTTTVTGTVLRGPVMPVCQTDTPCDAPFRAMFTVFRGSRPVASFSSDSTGRYTVMLSPGAYRVVAASDAPILNPGMQSRTIEVTNGDTETIDLTFDTGIR